MRQKRPRCTLWAQFTVPWGQGISVDPIPIHYGEKDWYCGIHPFSGAYVTESVTPTDARLIRSR